MALIIEDGTGVANANSYETLTALQAYATARGVTLPVGDAPQEILMVKAMDYIEAQEPRFQGTRSLTDQVLAFPRAGMVINRTEFAENAIPQQLKTAQLVLAIAAMTVDFTPTIPAGGNKGPIIREKVGPLEREYGYSGIGGNWPLMPYVAKAEPLLRVFYRPMMNIPAMRA